MTLNKKSMTILFLGMLMSFVSLFVLN